MLNLPAAGAVVSLLLRVSNCTRTRACARVYLICLTVVLRVNCNMYELQAMLRVSAKAQTELRALSPATEQVRSLAFGLDLNGCAML